MLTQTEETEVCIENAPDIPGLRFRTYRGKADHGLIADVINAASGAAGTTHRCSAEKLDHRYANLSNCDLTKDLLLAEVDGQVVAYIRVSWWDEEATSERVYATGSGMLSPEWLGGGIASAMVSWAEGRAKEIAGGHEVESEKVLHNWSTDKLPERTAFVKGAGYTAAGYDASMCRPTLDDLPEHALPPGFEVRPAAPGDYRAIWDANEEAFIDHWSYGKQTEEDYERWLNDPTVFQPELWKIAWDTEKNEIAGQVRSYIDQEENETFGRKRGYMEFISVRKPYRRKGLAKALIAASLHALKDAGMTEAALEVYTDNPDGAFGLYKELGFVTETIATTYRKPLSHL